MKKENQGGITLIALVINAIMYLHSKKGEPVPTQILINML